MNEFAGDIASMLEIALIGAGFVILHYALREDSKLMKAGAYVMLVGGTLGLICTSMFWFKYWNAGQFNHPASVAVHVVDEPIKNRHYFSEE